MREKKDRADLKKENLAFAGPGCYEGCGEESGTIVTVIPAKKIETRTYTKEFNQGDTKENYDRDGKEQ